MATRKACSVKGCDRAMLARGWCHAHYYAWWYEQDPDRKQRKLANDRKVRDSDEHRARERERNRRRKVKLR